MCTSFRLTADDGTVVVGRTMEYGLVVPWDLLVVPRGVTGVSAGPDGPAHEWTATFGYVGIAAGEGTVLGKYAMPAQSSVTDGVNEVGLAAALLYLPGYAEYEPADCADAAKLLSPIDMASVVLATCTTVGDAIAAMESLTVWAGPMPVIGVPPLHLVLHDAAGRSAVIEYVGGERHVHENRLGVCTNSPPFDWHLANLRNYINLTPTDAPAKTVAQLQLSALGQGSGLLGLPGDPTPPSRFVRAATLAACATPSADCAGTAATALHLLNNFDIPKGMVRDSATEGLEGTDGAGDYTAWSTVAELGTERAYTVRTYLDPTPRRLALADAPLDGDAVIRRGLDAVAPVAALAL